MLFFKHHSLDCQEFHAVGVHEGEVKSIPRVDAGVWVLASGDPVRPVEELLVLSIADGYVEFHPEGKVVLGE